MRDGDFRLSAPPRFVAEVAAVLARETPATALRDLADLLQLEIGIVDDAATRVRAVELAIATGQHVLDTQHHAIALGHPDAVLVTADERYWRAARAEGRIVRLARTAPRPPRMTAIATTAAPRTTALALAAAVLAAASFIAMDGTAKWLGERYGSAQVTFLRFAFGTLYAVPLWLWWRTPLPTRSQWRWHLLRSALLIVALLTWFHALKVLPLVQAVGIGYTAPIFISLLAMWALRERPSRWLWAAMALGMSGVVVGLWPELGSVDAGGGGARPWGMAAAGVSALAYAGVMVVARHQARQDALWTILLVQNVVPTIVLAAPLWWLWEPMRVSDVPILLLMGGFATIGMVAITWAYTHVEASRAAPLEYTGLVWAALLGWLAFGEIPTGWSIGSAALIVLGCLLLLRR